MKKEKEFRIGFITRLACAYLGISPWDLWDYRKKEILNYNEILMLHELMSSEHLDPPDIAKINNIVKNAKGQKEIAEKQLEDMFRLEKSLKR